MNNYIINTKNMTIHNADSNGAKPINDIHGYGFDNAHLSYVNDDGRVWYQLLTDGEAAQVDYYLNTPNVEAPYTAEDYGMGVQI